MDKGILGGLSQMIGVTGEQLVARELAAKGFVSVSVNTRGAGSTDVIAHNPMNGGVLVQVKSCGILGMPAALTDEEIDAIQSRAERLGFQAWYAAVTLGAPPTISWQRLA